MTTLPTTREFLTSLINTLTTSHPTPPHPHPQLSKPIEPHATDADCTNALKSISPQQRALLATMHVVFPPPMLLHALDLLDRGLVVRIIETEHWGEAGSGVGPGGGRDTRGRWEERGAGGREVQTVWPPQANIHLPPPPPPPPPQPNEGSSPPWVEDMNTSSPTQPQKRRKARNQIHQVRSSQAPRSRFSHSASSSSTGRPGSSGAGTGGPGTLYTVRLEAWNCSCAAFAFSSFPAFASSSSFHPWNLPSTPEDQDRDSDNENENKLTAAREAGERDTDPEWAFGGTSLNGRGGGGVGSEDSVPVCKHLLACLLGERWGDVLGRYVKEREVSREEMAGLGGEG